MRVSCVLLQPTYLVSPVEKVLLCIAADGRRPSLQQGAKPSQLGPGGRHDKHA